MRLKTDKEAGEKREQKQNLKCKFKGRILNKVLGFLSHSRLKGQGLKRKNAPIFWFELVTTQ